MKYFITISSILLLLSGCSKNNAFDDFKMNKEQELAINSLQSSKINSNDGVSGIFSAVYLNEVYPKEFNHNEYFFVYFYTKEKSTIFDPVSQQDSNSNVKLNGKPPVKIKKLSNQNQFTHLVGTKNEWSEYYLIAFEHDASKKLSLTFESGQSLSDQLIYQKG
jgi:hypothetical protein